MIHSVAPGWSASRDNNEGESCHICRNSEFVPILLLEATGSSRVGQPKTIPAEDAPTFPFFGSQRLQQQPSITAPLRQQARHTSPVRLRHHSVQQRLISNPPKKPFPHPLFSKPVESDRSVLLFPSFSLDQSTNWRARTLLSQKHLCCPEGELHRPSRLVASWPGFAGARCRLL